MIGLDRALDRLLHCRSVREAFLAGRPDGLDLPAEDREALAGLDREALVREAESVREDLLHRRHRGSGGLPALYPRTLAAWTAAHPEDGGLVELLSRFMESKAFDAYREVPFAGQGCCLEEAFHRFCEAEEIGTPAVREEEMLGAMMRALLLSPDPAFTVPGEIRRTAGGFFAVARRGAEPRLFAAISGRMIAGPLTPFLADLLTLDEPPAEIAACHAVAPAILDASLARLRDLGLVPA